MLRCQVWWTNDRYWRNNSRGRGIYKFKYKALNYFLEKVRNGGLELASLGLSAE